MDTDRGLVARHYSLGLKAWLGDGVHDGGVGDSRIGVIRVRSDLIAYSVNNRGVVGRAFDVAKGVVTGETPGFVRVRDIKGVGLERIRKGGCLNDRQRGWRKGKVLIGREIQ